MVPVENNILSSSEMMSAADEPRVLCIVRDMTNPDKQTKFTLNLPCSTSVRVFLRDVGTSLGYVENTFTVSYEQPVPSDNGGSELEEVIMSDYLDAQLKDICVHCGDRRRNNFNVLDKDGIPPIHVEPPTSDDTSLDIDTLTLGATASPISESETYSSNARTSYSSPLMSDYTPTYPSTLIRSDTGYVGLVNQAMTCYLNSLLQTLYMTPEFRNAIYRWSFDGSEEEALRSIPYQLQRLFLQLQTSKRRAIETTDITKSFGWDSSESWQQHDVQELCRVMFDALEKKWRNTDQGHLINHLYQGKMKDYVKCLECGYESARMDTYLDIPLVIRPFGSNTAYASVEEALKAFIQPETLDGNNQYYCERCGKKCDAHKGLKFTSFPYLLTLQLKRFDFDYATMHRIKLNDRMTFPEILNLNHMLDDCPQTSSSELSEVTSDTASEEANKASDDGNDGTDLGYNTSETPLNSTSDSSLNSTEAAVNDKNTEDSVKNGPYEYELFSIMIHSGSAAGGHYYAFIKSFTDGHWYSFNDQHVSTITYDDICKTFGGSNTSRGFYSSAFASSTNAYMLLYRQIDKEKNKDYMQVEDFPEHLQSELTSIQDREEAERLQRELDRCTCRIKLFCFHPVHRKQVEGKLEIHKDRTLLEATETAWKQFELDEVVPLDCVRLVRYNELQDWVEQSFDEDDATPISKVLGGVKAMYTFNLLMEVKQPGMQFQQYKPGGVTVKVCIVDLEDETISAPVTVRAYLTQTVADFKQLVSQTTGFPEDKMRCVLERCQNELKLLEVPAKVLKTEGFVRSNKVFIECACPEDESSLPFNQTRFYKLLDRYENTIRIHIALPPFGKVDANQDKTLPSPEEPGNSSDKPGEGTSVSSRVNGEKDTQPASSRSGVTGSGDHASVGAANEKPPPPPPPPPPASTGSSHYEGGTPAAPVKPREKTRDEDDVNGEAAESCPVEDEEFRRYFTGAIHIDAQTGERNLTVYVDKRITFGTFKKELEPYVCAPSDYFRVYRIYGSNHEIETVRLSDTLTVLDDDNKLVVKLGRALKKGEQRMKVYLLQPKKAQPWSQLLETVFPTGMMVLESKKIIVKEAKAQCDMDIPVDRCRLRKKTYNNPGNILLDSQIYDQNTQIIEIFLEILEEPEMMSPGCLQLYVRRWFPSQYKVGPIEEVILEEQSSLELKEKLSQISEIPVENIVFAKGRGVFPYEVSLLDLHHSLDWDVDVPNLKMWPLHISEDGHLIYYRDQMEKLVDLDEPRKKELAQSESTRLSRVHKITSPRKERALKIYTDDPAEL